MFRNLLLVAVLALALPGAAFADSGHIINFNFNGGSFWQPQPTFQISGDFFPNGNFLHSNGGADGFPSTGFILNSNRGYFNGFTYTFGNSVVATPEPGSLVLLAISLLGLAFAFRRKLKLQTSD